MGPQTQPTPPPAAHGNRLRKNAWHRRASRPVTLWMFAFVIGALLHPWLHQPRWVLIHIFTLGALTNSIMLWSQSLTEKFLHQPLPEDTRPWQLRRFTILNLGIIAVLLGQLSEPIWSQHWIITSIGSLIVGGSLAFHAYYLATQYLRADRTTRFAPAVLGYVASASFLPLGALGGAAMSAKPQGMWHDRIILAHIICNALGFVGCAAIASLSLLFAAIWRTQAGESKLRSALIAMVIGALTASIAALTDLPWLLALGLGIYALGILLAAWQWVECVAKVLRQPRDRITYASLSVAFAPLWLIFGLLRVIFAALNTPTVVTIELPTLEFVVGFAAQLLLGVMSYLLPTNIGGGPGATRTGLQAYNRAGLLRSTTLNGGLLLWILAPNNTITTLASIACILSLASFLILTPMAVRAQLAVLKRQQAAAEPKTPAWWQIPAGIALLAAIFSIGSFTQTNIPGSYQNDADIKTVHIQAEHMKFAPTEIHVPRGTNLQLEIENTDDMAHDLRLEHGAASKRLTPGETITLDVGTVEENIKGWCTIAGHRAKGMEFNIVVQ